VSFFCDIDVSDFNGFTSSGIQLSIEQEIPFITTRSLLRGGKSRETRTREFEELILKQISKWEIYQFCDSEHGEEFFVFLPFSLFPDKQGIEKLKALGFVTDGSLKKASIREAFQVPKGKNNIDALFNLFEKESNVNKLLHLVGHGLEDHVGGLNKENYQKLVTFLEPQNCRAFIVSSCHSAGKNSRLNFPNASQERPIPRFEEQGQGPSFPIILRSLGDFPVFTGHNAEKNLSLLFKELALFLESSKPATVSGLRSVLKKVEQGVSKGPQNFIQVYFPSANTYRGFRPIDEQNGHSLTYCIVKGPIQILGIPLTSRKNHCCTWQVLKEIKK
jgi:hypothetical protein